MRTTLEAPKSYAGGGGPEQKGCRPITNILGHNDVGADLGSTQWEVMMKNVNWIGMDRFNDAGCGLELCIVQSPRRVEQQSGATDSRRRFCMIITRVQRTGSAKLPPTATFDCGQLSQTAILCMFKDS